jgi:phage tail sheath protein FI
LAGGEVKTKAITLNDYQGDVNQRTGLGGLEPLDDVTMVIAPDLMSAYEAGELDEKGVQAVQQSLIDYCELVRYCFAILDAPPGLMPQEVKEWRFQVNYDSSRAALYYPWIEIADLTGSNGRTRHVPPSGHVAGVYARVDNTRGVHKAPANELIRGCLGLDVQVTKGEQDLLNPIGVNCIRSFPGRGIRIWGARTLSSDPAWRYVPVRRLFNMIEESIERGTQWVVFEPNDPFLWGRINRDVSSFLKMIWGTGALFGSSPSDAFYVKCDAETNPPELRDLGQLVVEIGVAPVKPAEFVIFRISQWSGADD